MFGKELHKIEGYIQDKRYTRPTVPSAASFLFYQPPPPPFTPPCLPPLPSKKKHCIIYGKWTECLWSVDPQAYEAHKKLEKKGDKKLKNVRKPLTIIAIMNLSHHFCLSFSCWRYRCRILGCLQWNNFVKRTEPCEDLVVLCLNQKPGLSGSSDLFRLSTLIQPMIDSNSENHCLQEEPQGAENDEADDMPEVQETVSVIPGSTLLWRIDSRPPQSTMVQKHRHMANSW